MRRGKAVNFPKMNAVSAVLNRERSPMKRLRKINLKNLFLTIVALTGLCFLFCGNSFSLNAEEGTAAPTIPSEDGVTVSSERAMLCSSCAFGNGKSNCANCGKWMASNQIPAYLCSNCGFGTRKDNCVKCGKWIGGHGYPASICSNCGFGTGKDNCVKCGRWRGGN